MTLIINHNLSSTPCRLSPDLYSHRLNAPIVSLSRSITICICRRARLERESRIKAMQAREKKGVCSTQQYYTSLFLRSATAVERRGKGYPSN